VSRSLIIVIAGALAALLCGCAGYRHGATLSHPELKSVAIGEIRNASQTPHLETYLRQHLAEQFSADGTLRLVSVDDADCIVIAEVADFEIAGIAETRIASAREEQRINRSTAFRSDVSVNWRLDLPNAATPLLKPRKTVGRGIYPERLDQAQAQQAGLKQATHDAARQIVSAVTEGW
jgi:hypothetical protein